MATYATAAELDAYLLDTPEVSAPGGEATERLLQRAERQVDLVVGPWPRFSSGLKFDPALLDTTQQAALSRACCAAAQFLLVVDAETLIGDDDYLPDGAVILRRAAKVSPKMVAELSGHGLLKYTGTALPTVDLPLA